MNELLEALLRNFCFIAALLAVSNLLFYRRALERNCDPTLAREVFAKFRWIVLFTVVLLVALGILQTLAGIPIPVVPFVLPSLESPLVAASWALVVLGNLGLVSYLSRIEPRIAEEIARVFLANLAAGRTALVVLRTAVLVGTSALIVIPWALSIVAP